MLVRLRKTALLGVLVTALTASTWVMTATASTAAMPVTAQLVGIRAASHPGFDRVVWQFDGPLPNTRIIRYVDSVIHDGSGEPVRVSGAAKLHLTMFQANAHNPDTGVLTAPRRVAFGLSNVTEVVNSGDFEATVSYGIGLVKQQPYKLFTLTNPSRVVLDVRTDYAKSWRGVHFLDVAKFAEGRLPYTEARPRQVPALSPAAGVLYQLYAGPTAAERSGGLSFQRSGSTGFRNLSINNTTKVAKVTLTGGCNSGGSTFTVANLIMPTLKQFPNVDYVKVYDPQGSTGSPTGRSDSIPACLEP